MRIYTWEDRRDPSPAQAVIETGHCIGGVCRAWSVSISNGEVGITARFDNKEEFDEFMRTGVAREGVCMLTSSR